MQVQICGAGISGSYLYMLLRDEHRVKVKEVRDTVDCVCAWGIAYRQAKELYREIGLNFDEYVLSKPKFAIANGIKFKNKNIVTFDRKSLLEELWKEIEFGQNDADIYIDATGTERALLPKIKEDKIYLTVQYLEEHEIEENVYAYARKTGYAWAFPLGDNRWHLGAGDISYERAEELIKKLREFYGFNEKNVFCSCRGKVRMLPPSKCKPFVFEKIVGVGEAIGCVSGFGEGNAPSLECAKILFENFYDRSEYEKEVLRRFKWIEIEHKLVECMQNGKKISAMLKIPRVAMIERKRSAFSLNFFKLIKI
ncbi:MAG: NAD(P)/FAD-dependent oxidoreductase [Archaeoglobaceae archaeon]|nr:NAD(P)/FAD-dependent oxidoreductase [Archaeoglobaceae archaeon]MCX8152260.1 NAD(P)/FAD-dependent oxidoreductase [Archaeoglobaceae archaeon]MDW8013938.1 NAD(P)/FAD-dependent oxidoreductase [Archaeoglobaceae archaeon]